MSIIRIRNSVFCVDGRRSVRSRWPSIAVGARGCALIGVLAMLLVGCRDVRRNENAKTDIGKIPTASAPQGLGNAKLPASDQDITSLFARLPPTVAGQPRTPQLDQAGPRRHAVTYGDGTSDGRRYRIQAIDVSAGDFYPKGWTAGDVIAAKTVAQGEGLVASGREGPLVWTREETVETSSGGRRSTLFVISWGAAPSRWLFAAQADTLESLDALVEAFVRS